MKIFILITMLILQIEAQSLIYPNGGEEKFVLKIDKNRAFNKKEKIYYKNGLISPKTEYKDTRKLYISFGKVVDIDYFSQKYGLKFLKITNKKFYTALFKLKDSRDIIEVCSQINKNENIRYAKPNWKAPRGLK